MAQKVIWHPNMAPSFLLLHVITNEKSLKSTQIGRLLSASRASQQKHVPTTLVGIPVDIYTLVEASHSLWGFRPSRPLTRYEGWYRRGLSLVIWGLIPSRPLTRYEGWYRLGLSLVIWELRPSRPLTRYWNRFWDRAKFFPLSILWFHLCVLQWSLVRGKWPKLLSDAH